MTKKGSPAHNREILLYTINDLFMLWRKKYNLSELQDIINLVKIERYETRIAIIDDQNIALIPRIKKHNFNITHFKDIENIDDLLRFKIIICDIQGVGKKLGSKFEGAHLISEIKREYPLKYVIAFSGKSFDPTYNKFFKLCDDVMQKGSDINDWVNCLDLAISNYLDPIYNWESARKTLLEYNISLDEISKLEQAFIKTLLRKDISIYNKLIKKNQTSYSNAVSTVSAIGTYLSFIHSLIS